MTPRSESLPFHMSPKLLIPFSLLTGLAVSTIPAHAADPQKLLRWQQDAGSVALMQGEAVVWQFHHAAKLPKPFFHPLAVPGRPVLTADQPADHPWHHGLWFSWKFINGVNYWEPPSPDSLPVGRTEWDNVIIDKRPDFSARISMDLRYRPPGQEPVLTEQRLIEVSAPAADGTFSLDWTLTFKAGQHAVLLSRTPIPGEPEGVAWGGYAGLSVRFANQLSGVRMTSSDGPVNLPAGTYRGKASAMDYSGLLDRHEAGIAILDHPANLNSPSPWYVARENPMLYFSPAVLCYGPHTLKAGQTLRLRYRVLVHPGHWDAETLRAKVRDYAVPQSKP